MSPFILEGISWVIVGGESGAGARPIKQEWVLSIRDQCLKVGVPFFFKQWGGVHKKQTGRKLEGRTYDEFSSRVELPVMETRRRLAAITEVTALYPLVSTKNEPGLFSAQGRNSPETLP